MIETALVRHELENLLYTYAALADTGDAGAISELLADAAVTFDGGEPVTGRGAIAALYSRRGTPGRHLVTNVIVTSTTEATAHYSRWSLEDEPRLTALGRYYLALDLRTPRIIRLDVSRDWQAN